MKYIITENQYKMLFEFMQRGFDLDALDKIPDFKDKIEYCERYLGEDIGSGLGRVAFDVSDNVVLKVAKGYGGISQNEQEWNNVKKLSKKYDIIMQVYKHAKDFSWIVCERVLQVTPTDFEHILGIPYEGIYCLYKGMGDNYKNGKNYEEYMNNWDSSDYEEYSKYNQNLDDYKEYTLQDGSQIDYKNSKNEIVNVKEFIYWSVEVIKDLGLYSVKDIIEHSEYTTDSKFKTMVKYFINNKNEFVRSWFRQLFEYLCDINGNSDLHIGNFGLAIRNGKPTIVILDVGYDRLNF